MKIFIVNSRLRNLGDRAIVACMIAQMRHAFPGCELSFDSDDVELMREAFPEVKVVPAMIDVGKIKQTARAYSPEYFFKNAGFVIKALATYAFGWAYAVLKLSWSPIPYLHECATSDLVIWAGGDYTSDIYGIRYRLRLFELHLAKLMGKPVVLYAQTIGPFEERNREAVRKGLSKADLILARDTTTEALLSRFGIVGNVQRVMDSVILLEPEETPRVTEEARRFGLDGKTVGFNVMDQMYTGIADDAYRAYEEGMVALMRHVEALGWRIVLFPATTEDSERARSINERYGLSYPVCDTYEYGSGEAKALLGRLAALVSSRMHPIIIATTSGVPTLGINKLQKSRDYLAEVGLGDSCLPMVPFDLPAATAKLDDFLRRLPELRERLRTRLPVVRAESGKSAAYVREIMRPAHLVLTTIFLPSFGGKEVSIDRTARALASRGEPVEIVCFGYPEQSDADAFDRGYPLKVTRIRSRFADATYHFMHGMSRRLPDDAPFRKAVMAFAAGAEACVSSAYLFMGASARIRERREHQIVIHCHTFGAVLAARLCRRLSPKRVAVTYVNGFVHRRVGIGPVDAFIAWALRGVDASLCVSEASSKALVDAFGLEPRKVHAYGNWIETAPIDAIVPPSSYLDRPYAEVKRVLYVGRIERDKGISELLDLIRSLRREGVSGGYRFTVAGGGDAGLRRELETEAAIPDGLLTYLGEVGKPELWRHYAEADVLLLPSKWEEAGANVALEAAVFGVPVVGTRRGGIPEKLAPFRHHRLVDALDPDSLRTAIDGLRGEIQAVGRQAVFDDARTTLERFGPERNFTVYARACDDLFA